MYKCIVIPVDLSGTGKSEEMIEKAKSLADPDASFHLVHVLEAIPLYIEAQVPDSFHHQALEEATQAVKAIADASGLVVQTQIRSGGASTEIMDMAEEVGADLILIRSHKPGLQDYFLGSTASRVVRHAKCSVLVMR
ncbi:MAG: universal stress protein [Thiolinea sp.]